MNKNKATPLGEDEGLTNPLIEAEDLIDPLFEAEIPPMTGNDFPQSQVRSNESGQNVQNELIDNAAAVAFDKKSVDQFLNVPYERPEQYQFPASLLHDRSKKVIPAYIQPTPFNTAVADFSFHNTTPYPKFGDDLPANYPDYSRVVGQVNSGSPLPTFIGGSDDDTEIDVGERASEKLFFKHRGENKFYVFDPSRGFHVAVTKHQLKELVRKVEHTVVHAKGTASFIKSVAESMCIDEDTEVSKEQEENSRHYVAFANCRVNLRDRTLEPTDPSVFLECGIMTRYDPHAACPYFKRYLERVTGNRTELIDRIWEMIGYCLTPDAAAKKFFFLEGEGNTGKSLLCSVIQALLPSASVAAITAHRLSKQFAISELGGKQLWCPPDFTDAPLNQVVVGNIKALTGLDKISAAKKYHPDEEFVYWGKIVFASNHSLKLKTSDEAFCDRICRVPFDFPLSETEKERELFNLLIIELPGIAFRAMRAYFQLVDADYKFSGDFEVQPLLTDEVDELNGIILSFLDRHVYYKAGSWLPFPFLYKAFCQETNCTISETGFSRRVNRLRQDLDIARKKHRIDSESINCYKDYAFR